MNEIERATTAWHEADRALAACRVHATETSAPGTAAGAKTIRAEASVRTAVEGLLVAIRSTTPIATIQ